MPDQEPADQGQGDQGGPEQVRNGIAQASSGLGALLEDPTQPVRRGSPTP